MVMLQTTLAVPAAEMTDVFQSDDMKGDDLVLFPFITGAIIGSSVAKAHIYKKELKRERERYRGHY